MPNKSYRFYRKSNTRMRYKKTIIAAGVIVGVVGGITIGTMMNTQHTANAVYQYQSNDAKTKRRIATKGQREKVKPIDYSGNVAISNLAQVKKYRHSSGQLYLVGFVAIPKQDGVINPVTTMQINEGVSNKVLAYGAGTVKPDQELGKRNFAIAAHNYGDDRTGFSPLQRDINVDKQPKAYLSDGHMVFIYQFNKRQDDISGEKVVNRKNVEVASDSRVQSKKALLTLITCDEPGIFNLHPDNRRILTAHLIDTMPLPDASESIQKLFIN